MEITSDNESHRDMGNTKHGNRMNIPHDDSKIPPIEHGELKWTENSSKNVSNLINETNAEDSLISDLFMGDKDIQSSAANDCNIWNTCEDWRGKAEKESKRIAEPKESPIKKRAKPLHLDTCPEWEYIKDTKVSRLPAFKNDLFCEPVIMGKLRLNLQKTCAFDSLFQVIMSAMASNRVYCKILEKSTNQTI